MFLASLAGTGWRCSAHDHDLALSHRRGRKRGAEVLRGPRAAVGGGCGVQVAVGIGRHGGGVHSRHGHQGESFRIVKCVGSVCVRGLLVG